MEDKEIVKALELCLKNECDKCPFNLSEVCQIDLMKLLFDLINRLQAENKSQSIMIKMLNGSIEDYKNSYINQKAENERLKAEKRKIENKIEEIYPLVMELPKVMETAKAEAYKEFDELLKDECLSYPLKKDDTTMLVDVERYNNLLKELVGEDNV